MNERLQMNLYNPQTLPKRKNEQGVWCLEQIGGLVYIDVKGHAHDLSHSRPRAWEQALVNIAQKCFESILWGVGWDPPALSPRPA